MSTFVEKFKNMFGFGKMNKVKAFNLPAPIPFAPQNVKVGWYQAVGDSLSYSEDYYVEALVNGKERRFIVMNSGDVFYDINAKKHLELQTDPEYDLCDQIMEFISEEEFTRKEAEEKIEQAKKIEVAIEFFNKRDEFNAQEATGKLIDHLIKEVNENQKKVKKPRKAKKVKEEEPIAGDIAPIQGATNGDWTPEANSANLTEISTDTIIVNMPKPEEIVTVIKDKKDKSKTK